MSPLSQSKATTEGEEIRGEERKEERITAEI